MGINITNVAPTESTDRTDHMMSGDVNAPVWLAAIDIICVAIH